MFTSDSINEDDCRCPNNHKMEWIRKIPDKTVEENGEKCNMCFKKVSERRGFMHCKTCLIEYCHRCYNKEKLYIAPLHIAYQLNNNHSVNLLLKYMAKIEYSSFDVIRMIMPKLIDSTALTTFLSE